MGTSAAAGADMIVSINASPFYRGKHIDRAEILRRRNAETGTALIYLNCVGGQDELVFDGHSLAIDAAGKLSSPARPCESRLLLIGFDSADAEPKYLDWPGGFGPVKDCLKGLVYPPAIGRNGISTAIPTLLSSACHPPSLRRAKRIRIHWRRTTSGTRS